MSFKTPLDHIQDADHVILEIIKKTERLLEGSEKKTFMSNKSKFRDIKIYGSSENPLVICNDIYRYIHGNIFNVSRDTKKFKIKKEIIRQIDVHTTQHDENGVIQHVVKSVNLLTKNGLMRLMYIKNNDFTELFRDFVMELLETLYEKHQDVLHQAMATVGQKLESAQKQIDTQEQTIFHNQTQFARLEQLNEFIGNEDMLGDAERQELTLLRNLHMRKIPLYIVSGDYVKTTHLKKSAPAKPSTIKKTTHPRKRGQFLSSDLPDSESDSDIDLEVKSQQQQDHSASDTLDDGVEYTLPLKCYSQLTLSSDYANDEFYFYIAGFTTKKELTKAHYHKVCDLHISDAKHYKAMMKKLASTDAQTAAKGVLRLTYNNIADARTSSFMDENFTMTKKPVKYRGF